MGRRAMAGFLLRVIRGYRRAISPMLPPSCRFTPTCSGYADEAITRYGARKGGWLAVRRILRCHPFGGSGYDPVPGTVPDQSDNHDTSVNG